MEKIIEPDYEKILKELTELYDEAYESYVHANQNAFLIRIGTVCHDTITYLKKNELVRCKDCKFRYSKECDAFDIRTRPDDWFCAGGKHD